MATILIRQPAGLRLVAPRGAVWAANFGAAIYRGLEQMGSRRAEKALLELAARKETSNPTLAAELRAAAARSRAGATTGA